jgi:phage head maturation protease
MDIYEVKDTTKINDFKEVEKLELSKITRNEGDKELLTGLIISGFEMKFGKINENSEMFESTCIDDYMQNYFVKNKLNVPVTVLHRYDLFHLVGRVLVIETSTTGFYFTVYIPRGVTGYDDIKLKIKEGILQGFSKEGWADEYEVKYTKDGEFDYVLIKKLIFASLSIVSTPANSLRFDKIGETANIINSTKFVNKHKETPAKADDLDELFN